MSTEQPGYSSPFPESRRLVGLVPVRVFLIPSSPGPSQLSLLQVSVGAFALSGQQSPHSAGC